MKLYKKLHPYEAAMRDCAYSTYESDFNNGNIGVGHTINNPFENEINVAANRIYY